jgi:hypothetical protein
MFICRGRVQHPVIAIDQLPIRPGKQTTRRVCVVITDVEEFQAEVWDTAHFNHTPVQGCIAIAIARIHTRRRIETQRIFARRDGRLPGYLAVAHHIFQDVAAK